MFDGRKAEKSRSLRALVSDLPFYGADIEERIAKTTVRT
jgi:hypothetical protein